MANKEIQHADVVIIGAGMAGCLLALAIIQKSPALSVVLIDENKEKVDKGKHPAFDARSIALSAGSCDLLDQIDLWRSLAINAQPIDDIHISDRGNMGIVELDSLQRDQPFGYVVELQDVGASLQRKLNDSPQIQIIYSNSLLSVEKHQASVLCELQGKKQIQAKLCVAADGANSRTNHLLSIPSEHADYGCSAIIANISTGLAHNNRAFERFTSAGPLALLPLTGDRYSLVWSVKNSELQALLSLSEGAFLDKLQHAFGYRAGIFKKAGKRESYPLKLIKTDKPITHRGVAIGNAAHCLHPVMGQGFNLGMRDLSVLATVISENSDKSELGGYAMLNKYWLARKKDHHTTINMTDAIVRIFSNNHFPFVVGRTIALQAIACFSGLGEPIVKQAKGQFKLIQQEEKS